MKNNISNKICSVSRKTFCDWYEFVSDMKTLPRLFNMIYISLKMELRIRFYMKVKIFILIILYKK